MAQGPVSLDEGLLHHVFGFGRIVNETRHQAHQAALVLGDEQIESPLVPGLDALYQQLITLAFCRHGPCPNGGPLS